MRHSMTGFAAATGAFQDWSWTWDLRSVNGRGLELRLRVPEWIEGLETALRPALQSAIARGNVTLNCRVLRSTEAVEGQINPAALERVLDQVAEIENAAMARGVSIVAPSATDILSQRGVLETRAAETADTAPLRAALLDGLPALLDGFNAMRAAEGNALAAVLMGQVDRIAALTAEARGLCDARQAQMAAALRDQLAKVMDNTEGADPDRVAQELALIAVKSDITEEIDRLTAHVEAARALLAEEGPVGRKLDFLTQEFMREANTLCAKSQHAPLTRVGLELKTTIDQLREQVQNVE
ncbi:YicC/YloC family endoribonuclease [Oceaniglobus roseus]|uniref:YicC/YloC family endoribonuclease n=1 Tax=Oceaniglobus roseus TaxID=1737570 RepID=UPI000C7EE3B1|nr:YicC/YloC family endoribonuclease [Kandeliimicrobium roseum]